jgi:hypothetical protein
MGSHIFLTASNWSVLVNALLQFQTTAGRETERQTIGKGEIKRPEVLSFIFLM